MSSNADFGVSDHGSIVLIHPLTDAAREWFDENVADDAPMHGDAFAVERRYAPAIIDGMGADGLVGTRLWRN